MIQFTFLVGFNFVKLLFFYSSYTSHCVHFIGLITEKGRVLQYFELWIFLAEIEIVYFLNQIWKIQGKNLNFQENCHWKLWNVKGFFSSLEHPENVPHSRFKKVSHPKNVYIKMSSTKKPLHVYEYFLIEKIATLLTL